MSDTPWTPGPWEVSDIGDYADFDGRSIVVIGDDRRVCATHAGGDDPEGTANARLIAAAPELAEALQMFIEHYPAGINSFLDDAHKAARAALRKARGDQS